MGYRDHFQRQIFSFWSRTIIISIVQPTQMPTKYHQLYPSIFFDSSSHPVTSRETPASTIWISLSSNVPLTVINSISLIKVQLITISPAQPIKKIRRETQVVPQRTEDSVNRKFSTIDSIMPIKVFMKIVTLSRFDTRIVKKRKRMLEIAQSPHAVLFQQFSMAAQTPIKAKLTTTEQQMNLCWLFVRMLLEGVMVMLSRTILRQRKARRRRHPSPTTRHTRNQKGLTLIGRQWKRMTVSSECRVFKRIGIRILACQYLFVRNINSIAINYSRSLHAAYKRQLGSFKPQEADLLREFSRKLSI